jgi:hypothetical protein
VQFLGFPPCPVVAIFPEVFDHQSHVFQVPDASFRGPEPKTFRMLPYQRPRALDQLRRRGRGRGQFVQRIGSNTHVTTLCGLPGDRKNGVNHRFPGQGYRVAPIPEMP